MDKITVTLKLRMDVYNQMKELAQDQRRSITGQIEFILLNYLQGKEDKVNE